MRTPLRNPLWPPLAYLALALLMTWPLAARAATDLPGLGDALQQTWILAWNAHALATDPAAVWQAPIFYPYPNTAAYHDHHLIQSLLGAPVIWLTGNPVLAHNLLLLLSFALSGWAVYLLARDLCGQPWAAFVAGAGFAFCAYRLSHIVQLNILQTAWTPFALLFLARLLRPADRGGGRASDALLAGVFIGLQAANAVYYAFFCALLVGGLCALWAAEALWARWRRGRPLPWRQAALLAVAALLAALVAVPFLLPYLGLYQTLGIVRSPREVDNWSAPLRAYLSVTGENRLYGRLGEAVVDSGEMVLFPGLLIAALAMLAVGMSLNELRRRFLHRRPGGFPADPRAILFWGLAAAGAFVLSLGSAVRLVRFAEPLPIPTIYMALYGRVPGFDAMRVPARWGMLVSLALCLLAAVGLAALLRRAGPRARAALAAAALAIVLAEQFVAPIATTGPLLPRIAPVYHWLGQPSQRDLQVVLELPVDRQPRGAELERTVWRHFASLAHWKQLPVAYGALMPIGTLDLLARVQALPDPAALRYLQLLGVDTLVVHRDQYPPEQLAALLAGLEAAPTVRPRGEVGASRVYTLLPDPRLERFVSGEIPRERTIFIANSEPMPGMLALGLSRFWQERGYPVYGPGRVRYYGPLRAPGLGQVFDFGLLAEADDPRSYGFDSTGLLWRDNGLAFYRGDPAVRASLGLGEPVPGQFHPRYPAEIELAAEPGGLRVGATRLSWAAPAGALTIELDVASLAPAELRVGTAALPVPAGLSIARLELSPGQSARLVGDPATLAILRLQVRDGVGDTAVEPALVARAEAALSGETLEVRVRAAGADALRLDVRGAAALDERPIRLLAGAQPVVEGEELRFRASLLSPAAPWLEQSEPAADGRYIVYLKDAGRPEGPGQPVAKFNIRAGQVVDFEPVSLPLTAVR